MRPKASFPPILTVAVLLTMSPPAVAQQTGPPTVRSAEVAGIVATRRFAPGQWGLVGIRAANPTDRPARMRPSVYFAEDPSVQFAREMLVPPQTQRWSWCPVRVPDQLPRSFLSTEIRTLARDRSEGEEGRLAATDGALWSSHLVSVDRGPLIVAGVFDGVDPAGDDEVYQAAFAVQAAMNIESRVVPLWGDWLPPVAEGLDVVDLLVVAGDRPAGDAAGRAAIRQWLRGGGRMWIALDRVQPETVRLLLGEALCFHIVDRVGLTRVDIHQVTPSGTYSVETPREFDRPVEFLRVLLSGVEVVHSVNGWPASFRFGVGRGQVLCTTLGARGWVRPRTQADPRPPGRDSPCQSFALSALRSLMSELLAGREGSKVVGDQAPAFLAEEVGYRIPRLGLVGGVLGAFCLVLVGGGVWFWRRGTLERLAWIGPSAALAAAAVLAACGISTRQTIPPTVAFFQQAEVDPGGEEIDIDGLLALYHPEPSQVVPAATHGGMYWPDQTGLEGTIRCLVRTDLDVWHWEDLVLPAGVRFAPVRQTVRLDGPAMARGSFGPGGFVGALTGPFQSPGDAALVCPSGKKLAVRLREDGRFVAEPGDELSPGQYLRAALLTEQQRRRHAIYEQTLPPEATLPPQPRLYVWTDLIDLGFTVPATARQHGSALVAIPVSIEPVSSGRRVLVPSPFVTYRAVPFNKRRHSSAYDNARRQWVELRLPSETWLRFQLPAEVLPLAVDRAVLGVEIDAPSREVEILGISGNQTVVVANWHGPRGRLRLEIDRPALLALDAQGGLILAIRVGDESGREKADALVTESGPMWRIDAVALEVEGEVQPRHPDRRPR